MGDPVKFTFERRFGERRANPLLFEEKEPAIGLSMHQAAVAEAERAAWASGFEAAQIATRAEEAARFANAFEALDARIAELSRDLSGLREDASAEAVRFALAFSRTLAGGLVARLALTRIEDAARAILADVRGAPHLALTICPDLVEGAREKLGALLREKGFEGRLVVLGDPEIARGDARLEWADGGIVLDQGATARRIETAVSGLLSSLDASHPEPEGRAP